jgi:3-oxoacyl-[acyl-carrier protein] reductase
MKTLHGKVAIVTGASSGIGKGIAERLGREGASVMVGYRSDEAGAAETARTIRDSGSNSAIVQGDMRNYADAERLFEACLKAFGRPDILVNTAGIGAMQSLADTDEATFELVFGLNCRGTLFCLKQASIHLNDEGRVVNIGSSSATFPWPGTAMYAASKAAVRSMTEVAAVELGARRINVNMVIPGITDTPMSRKIPADATKPVAEASPWKRLGTPEDIAAVVAFLVGPDAQWVTGQAILANGGSGH